MKRKALPRLIVFFVFLLALSPLSSQEGAADIVALVDTSGTMLPWFDQVYARVLPDIAGKFVRLGDTFHIISFNSSATFELAQAVESEEDVSRIVSRFMLMYPLGSNSDILSGLDFTRNYLSSLNAQGEKIVIVISAGLFNPPPSSAYASFTLEQAQGELAGLAEAIREDGWQVYYIGLPLSDELSEGVAVTSLDGNAITAAPQAEGAGEASPDGAEQGEEGAGTKTGVGSVSFFRSPGFVFLTVFLILLALIILVIAIVFILRRSSKPSAEINKATGTGTGTQNSADRRQALFAEYADGKKPRGGASAAGGGLKAARAGENFHVSDSEGKIMLNLFVERQNTRIGKRNVHQMKAGSRLSLGGGKSAFLVFLVKFPANLAEVRYDGNTCSLAILKPEFFPYETSNIIENCFERPVTIVSDKGYPVTFMLRQFEDPIVALNRLLNSIYED